MTESDGYQTNSSTFGTLLSSQGSGAHHRLASRRTVGQPAKTYRVRAAESNSRALRIAPLEAATW